MKRICCLLLVLCCLSACSRAEPQWWEESVHVETLREQELTGEGVLVAVLDSGLASHPDLDGVELLAQPTDQLGHGTFVTGLLASLMPDASYLPLKITDTGTRISIDAITAGLEAAEAQGADVAILSLGLQEDVPELREAVESLADTGCLIFAAVGNDGTDTLYYPAAYDCVIGVGSCNLAFEPSETSQYNESVLVLAPGVKLTGPWLDGGYATWKGTSYAVPLAAAMGVAAKSCIPELDMEGFLTILQVSTNDICEPGYDIRSGWGIIDFEKLCLALEDA